MAMTRASCPASSRTPPQSSPRPHTSDSTPQRSLFQGLLQPAISRRTWLHGCDSRDWSLCFLLGRRPHRRRPRQTQDHSLRLAHLRRRWSAADLRDWIVHDVAGQDHRWSWCRNAFDHCARLSIRNLTASQSRKNGMHRIHGKHCRLCGQRLGRLLLLLHQGPLVLESSTGDAMHHGPASGRWQLAHLRVSEVSFMCALSNRGALLTRPGGCWTMIMTRRVS